MAPFRSPDPRDGAAPLVATVSLLQALQPVESRLQDVPGLTCPPTAELERRLACEGRLAVFQGSPQEARRVLQALRQLGLGATCNLQAGIAAVSAPA